MKICELSNVEVTYNFLVPLFAALRDEGHEVVAACTMDRDGAQLRHYLGDGFRFDKVPAARRLGLRELTVDVLELARYLRRERFDVVHIHSPLISMQGRVAARLAGIPTAIYHAHGFYFHEGMQPRTYRAARWVERTFCRHLTEIVVTINTEDHELATAQRFRPDPADIVHVPGVGIDTERFAPSAPGDDTGTLARGRVGIPPEATVVTFVGRLVAEKGLRELITAFDQVAATRPDLYLLVLGELHASERDQITGQWIRDFLARSPSGQRAVLPGRRHDVADLLRGTDIFVLPSYREGMPVSLLEAMATQVASIATDVRGCREAIGPDGGLLVPPADTAALAEALALLADDRALRDRLGARARRRVLDRFTTSHALEPMLEVFRRIDRSAASVAVDER